MRAVTSAFLSVVAAVAISGCRGPAAGEDAEDGARSGPAGLPRGHASLSAYPGAVLAAADEGSGTTVTVSADGRVVTAHDAGGRELLSVDVLEEYGSPVVGAPAVRHVRLEQGRIHVVVGKHGFATIDLATKVVECTGSD